MGIIFPFYRWENRGSERLTDKVESFPPAEGAQFEHRSVLLQASACSSMAHRLSSAKEAAEMQREGLAEFSVQGIIRLRRSLLALGFPPELSRAEVLATSQ